MLDYLSSAAGLPSGAIAWCLSECSQMGIMSVAIIIAPILLKHSDLVLRAGGSSPTLWSFIVVTGTIFGAVVSPIFGAAADSTSRRKPLLITLLIAFIMLNFLFIFTITFSVFGASLAASAMLVIYICSRSLHSSFIVFVYDTATVRRSFFVSTFCCNALVCILLIAVAGALRGHSPTIIFSFKLHLSLAFLSLALAYPFWSCVPDLKIDTLTVPQLPIVQSGTVFAFFQRIRSLVKQPQLFKFVAANFFIQDGMACLNHITTIYSAYTGVSDADLILGHILGRFFCSVSAVLWMPFCHRFGTRTSYFFSMSVGVVSCVLILFPMSPPLFWFLSALVGISDSGNQIFTRVLLSDVVFFEHVSATYGLASGLGRTNGIFCHALYALISASSQSAHTGLFAVVSFVVLGVLGMTFVDFASKHQ